MSMMIKSSRVVHEIVSNQFGTLLTKSSIVLSLTNHWQISIVAIVKRVVIMWKVDTTRIGSLCNAIRDWSILRHLGQSSAAKKTHVIETHVKVVSIDRIDRAELAKRVFESIDFFNILSTIR